MKILILTIVLGLAGFGNFFYVQVESQPEVSVKYSTFNADGELIMNSVRQQRSDGSWFEHQYYIYKGEVKAWKKVLGLVDKGVYDIKKDMMFFEGETGLIRENVSEFDLMTEQIQGYAVHKGNQNNDVIYYSPKLNVILKREHENGDTQIATSVIQRIDESVFKLPELEINYDFYVKELENMSNKTLAKKLKEKYVPKGYVVTEKYFCKEEK